MSCHGCADSFGFLKKEVGCPKCGFSYCKKCLRFKLVLEENPGKGMLVCHSCHEAANKSTTNLDKQSPEFAESVIRAMLKLETLENPAKPPITVYREGPRARLANLKRGLSVEDQKIVERLQSLRQDDGSESSRRRKSENPEQEVAMRLARLRGEEPPAEGKVSSQLIDRKENEADLIARLSEEVQLDSKHGKSLVSDIEERLALLRSSPNEKASTSQLPTSPPKQIESLSELEELSEEEQVKRIIERFKDEIALEAKTSTSEGLMDQDDAPPQPETIEGSASDDDDVDFDQLCRICDEKRATLKCAECDLDIFCKGCFREFHIELGETHKPTTL